MAEAFQILLIRYDLSNKGLHTRMAHKNPTTFSQNPMRFETIKRKMLNFAFTERLSFPKCIRPSKRQLIWQWLEPFLHYQLWHRYPRWCKWCPPRRQPPWNLKWWLLCGMEWRKIQSCSNMWLEGAVDAGKMLLKKGKEEHDMKKEKDANTWACKNLSSIHLGLEAILVPGVAGKEGKLRDTLIITLRPWVHNFVAGWRGLKPATT